ncbi:GrpB family protein [Staphylococcus xylosus]|uniref:GrpB family protein n=1 Tax=Staphylococcus xylosus TaxID=1288 RepID=UPI002D80D5A0|nr:GrpB family protein [Staphylococcus xylosus]
MMEIEVQHYQKQWPILFEIEQSNIKAILNEEVIKIHHIGSTAVENLKAKPIIDMLVVVTNIEKIDDYNELFMNLGYISLGENGITGRRFFKKGENPRTHHMHIFQQDKIYEINRHIAVRDYLRKHDVIAREYENLKEQLAQQFPDDRQSYCDGKDSFMKKLEQDALTWYLK